MKKLFVIVLIMFVVGCAPGAIKKADHLVVDFNDQVSPVQQITIAPASTLMSVEKPTTFPAFHLKIETNEELSVDDFFKVIADTHKINFVLNLTFDQKINLPRFEGSLPDLLAALQKSHGLFFSLIRKPAEAGYKATAPVIVVTDFKACQIGLQSQDDAERVTKIIEGFGVENISIDNINNAILFDAGYNQLNDISSYFNNYPLSVIDLDVVFLESEVSSEFAAGLDVSRIALEYQKATDAPLAVKITGNNGFTFSLETGAVSMLAVLQSLENYNKFNVLQRSLVSGLVGKSVTLDVSEKIPYVSKITSTAGQSGPAQRGYEFSEVSSGLTLNIVLLSANRDLVVLKNDLKYQQVVDFLTVGSSTDQVQQPIVNVRNVNSLISLRPGDVSKLASIRYVKKTASSSGLAGLGGMLRGREFREYEVNILIRAILRRYVSG